MHVCVCICMHVCVCICVHMCVCMYVRLYVCMCVHEVCMYVYLCMCACVCTYMWSISAMLVFAIYCGSYHNFEKIYDSNIYLIFVWSNILLE